MAQFSRETTLVLFDIDGTLTPARQVLSLTDHCLSSSTLTHLPCQSLTNCCASRWPRKCLTAWHDSKKKLQSLLLEVLTETSKLSNWVKKVASLAEPRTRPLTLLLSNPQTTEFYKYRQQIPLRERLCGCVWVVCVCALWCCQCVWCALRKEKMLKLRKPWMKWIMPLRRTVSWHLRKVSNFTPR